MDCDYYELDQSSITFITEDGYSISPSRDHNRNEKKFYLRAIQQSSIPLNDYFYIIVKGVWRNTKNSKDIIEYNLIYACRFISKMSLKLRPNMLTVLRG